ncbi:MAG: DEAD/DEAH box helicase, partial [Actinomycetota bacterium]|nr:DEAD/DEAH box helicase [Actinomycetota bacterium]
MSSTFLELGVPAGMAEILAQRGIASPFPIQTATLPPGLAGRDVCGRAPTGSGKTLAFGIPMVARVGKGRPRRPRALVLVPTRELAAQVCDQLVMLAGRGGPTAATFYGGVGFGPQLAALRRGVDIAVACPGRLTDLVNRGEADLRDVDIVVIDEADRMADMGFLPQVKVLLDTVKPDRQTMLFSATLDGDAGALIRRYQSNPARFEVDAGAEARPSRHLFWRVEGSERADLTAKLVHASWPAVVFCRTKRGADRLTRRLIQSGVGAEAIHGDRSQAQRERALAAFSAGRVQALVATDIAARGIHVDDVACVVNFDPPEDEKAYVHRSGRTGRAGAAGLIVSMVSHDQASDIKKIQAKLSMPRGIEQPDLASVNDGRPVRPKLRSVRPIPAAPPTPSAPTRRPAPGSGSHAKGGS